MSKIILATAVVSKLSREIYDLASASEEAHAEVWTTLRMIQIETARLLDYISAVRSDTVGSVSRNPGLVQAVCGRFADHGEAITYEMAWLDRVFMEISRINERAQDIRAGLHASAWPAAHFDAAIAVLRKQDAVYSVVRGALVSTKDHLERALESLGCQLSEESFALVVPPPIGDSRAKVPTPEAYGDLKILSEVVSSTRASYGSLPVRVQPLYGLGGRTRVVTGRTSRPADGNAPNVPGDTPSVAETNAQVPEEKTPPRGEHR